MTGATWGWIGGIAGTLIGLAGGAYGSWCSIRNARPGPPRRFMVWSVVILWLVLGVLMGLIGLVVAGMLPRWTVWVAQTAFLLALGPAIVLGNRHLSRLEAADRAPDPSKGDRS
ncbi:hypothetical protein [Roseospira goensis]|uniref:Uncharacterized protein n=1 Tax=Roseospira goensis TaxID=391922 RepID=A0A7W6WJM8_9PROT|nr:hypothetical protein [Roseospira goensis]MBB4284668.1 hypothetical protein [Roseospira goensis]